MVLNFLNEIYPFLYIPIGLIALAMGADRVLKGEEEESSKLKALGGISGLLLLALTIILSVNEYNSTESIITNYSILVGILLGMSLIARPFKELPLAFVISILVALGLLYLLLSAQDSEVSFASIPLEIILIVVMVIVLLVFIVSFVQEQAIDGLLFILGWGPVITFFGLIIVVQGITILIGYPNSDGILWYLPG